MGKNRFFYLFILACTALFYVLYPLWFGWYLLCAALLLPLFDLALSLPGILSRRVRLSVPYVIEQGDDGKLTVTTISKKCFFTGQIKVRLLEKRFDGDIKHRFTFGGSRCELEFETSHSGVIRFELPRLWTTSMMGLFSVPIPVRCKAETLILPTPAMPPNTAALPRSGTLRPKPGGGFSEAHDIRPYRQGDPINSVHWKLSAKHDALIIREALMQPPHNRLVSCAPWNTPEERDLVLGRLRWVSDYLLKNDCPHYVRLHDNGAIAELTQPGDLTAFLYRSLDSTTPSMSDPISLPTKFTWFFQVDARVESRSPREDLP